MVIGNNKDLKTLPSSVLNLPNLKFINLAGCKVHLPEGFDQVFNVTDNSGGGFYIRKIK